MIDAIASEEQFSRRILMASMAGTVIALLLVVEILAVRKPNSYVAIPQTAPPLLEAELVKASAPSALLSEVKKVSAPQPVAVEKKISTSLDAKGAAVPLKASDLAQINQTTAVSQPAAPSTHGPVVLDSPPPKLPSYLRDQNLKTSVLIEFTIQADGSSQPHLIGSSGNEEIDALALNSAKLWRFSSAFENGHPIPSQIRLRINFQVDEN